jgi:hypothetical protein
MNDSRCKKFLIIDDDRLLCHCVGEGLNYCAPVLNCHDRSKIIFINTYPSFENAVQAIGEQSLMGSIK